MFEMESVEHHEACECDCCKNWAVYAAKYSLPDGDEFHVCEVCLEAGDVDAQLAREANRLDEEALKAAERLREFAAKVRSLIGQIKLPTREAWETEKQKLRDEALVMNWSDYPEDDAEEWEGLQRADVDSAKARLAATESGRKVLAELDATARGGTRANRKGN
jgi:hypothetical protein